MRKSIALFTMLVAFAGHVLADQYKDEVIILDVPDGFEGPIQQSPGPQAKVVGYAKPYQNKSGSTLFQITEYEMGQALREMPEDQRGETADFYLQQFLGGVQRRRANFAAGKAERIVLGGVPGARVRWTGDADGQRTSGIMYCVVIGTVVVSFHTQDIDGAPPENRAAATKAFESVAVAPGG
jgi:hypothetical protein